MLVKGATSDDYIFLPSPLGVISYYKIHFDTGWILKYFQWTFGEI